MVEIKPAQEWMVKALYGETIERTVEAIVALDGDAVLGMAALYPENGRLVLVARITDKARQGLQACGHRRALLKAAREIMKRAKRWKLPVVVLADKRIEGADKLIAHLGFKPSGGDFYEWAP